MSTYFPEDILIGRIIDYAITKENGYYDIEIELSNNIGNLNKVYIIDNKHNGLYEKKAIGWFPIYKFNSEDYIGILRSHYKEHIKSALKNNKFIIKEIEKIENSKIIK